MKGWDLGNAKGIASDALFICLLSLPFVRVVQILTGKIAQFQGAFMISLVVGVDGVPSKEKGHFVVCSCFHDYVVFYCFLMMISCSYFNSFVNTGPCLFPFRHLVKGMSIGFLA